LLLSAVLLVARRPLLSIDISCQRGAQQQTRRTLLPWSIGQTNGRTPYRYKYPATDHASSVNISIN